MPPPSCGVVAPLRQRDLARRREPATGDPGVSPSRTCTGWLSSACRWVTPCQPPCRHGAQAAGRTSGSPELGRRAHRLAALGTASCKSALEPRQGPGFHPVIALAIRASYPRSSDSEHDTQLGGQPCSGRSSGGLQADSPSYSGSVAQRMAQSRGTMPAMDMRCADCGCLVDRGGVVDRCGDPECCCKDLPDTRYDPA